MTFRISLLTVRGPLVCALVSREGTWGRGDASFSFLIRNGIFQEGAMQACVPSVSYQPRNIRLIPERRDCKANSITRAQSNLVPLLLSELWIRSSPSSNCLLGLSNCLQLHPSKEKGSFSISLADWALTFLEVHVYITTLLVFLPVGYCQAIVSSGSNTDPQ